MNFIYLLSSAILYLTKLEGLELYVFWKTLDAMCFLSSMHIWEAFFCSVLAKWGPLWDHFEFTIAPVFAAGFGLLVGVMGTAGNGVSMQTLPGLAWCPVVRIDTGSPVRNLRIRFLPGSCLCLVVRIRADVRIELLGQVPAYSPVVRIKFQARIRKSCPDQESCQVVRFKSHVRFKLSC